MKEKDVKDQKTKLEQKKNRLAAEEIRLRLKERKIRTRHLIELGGLMVKASLDHLPSPTIYGALLSLYESLQGGLCRKVRIFSQGVSSPLFMQSTEDKLILNC